MISPSSPGILPEIRFPRRDLKFIVIYEIVNTIIILSSLSLFLEKIIVFLLKKKKKGIEKVYLHFGEGKRSPSTGNGTIKIVSCKISVT